MASADVLISSFVTLFLVIDPIGNATYYAVAARDHSERQKMQMAFKACMVSLIVVPLFIWQGSALLRVIHVHLPSFQIAGGLFLLLVAIKMVLGDEEQTADTSSTGAKDIAIFPLAIPFIAGPDTLAASLLLATRDDFSGFTSMILLGFVGVLAVSLILLLLAGPVARVLGPSILNALNKVIGMLLGAYAIEFMIEGWTTASSVHGL